MAQLRDLLVTGAARFVNGAYFGGASTFGSVTQPIWWNNGFPQATTYSLSATLNAGSANRLAYYSGTNVVSPSAHYASATQLGINITNASTIGSRSLYVNGASYYYDTMEARTGASHLGLKLGSTYLNAIDGDIIFQNNSAIRFGGDSWDYNVWAGLKYVHSNKKIVLGLADGTEFTANAAQSGGTFKIVGMSTVDMNKTASITNLAIGGGIYWNPYVESAGDWTDAASITVIAGGAAGGTELRIQQQNDANDIINLVASKWIYLNGKRAFTINDAWLRINEDNLFTGGIYTGQSIVRTDAQFQVGDSGSKFYANSSGNGYFNNTLGIAGTDTSYNLFVKGNTRVTDYIYRVYTASNQTPMIWMNGVDYDNYLFQISSGTTTKQYYGYGLKYIGTGSGVANYLRLYADNQNNTDVIATSWNENGQTGFGADPDTNFRIYVNGSSRFNGDIMLHRNVNGDSPALVFNRGTTINGTDSYDDWRIYVTGGAMHIQERGGTSNGVANAWTDNLVIDNKQITLPDTKTPSRLMWTDGNRIVQAANHYASSDRVGINYTSAPSYNFYVNGTTSLNGTFNLPTVTANRLMWTDSSKNVQASYHYASADRIAINYTSNPSYNLYVNGTAYFNGQVTATQFNGPLNGNATSATNVAWSGITNKPPYYDIPRYTSDIGFYKSSDTHILKLGYWNCTGSYDNLTLLVSSSFWGNQHGSTDIITLRQDLNDNSNGKVQCSCNRVTLMNSNRIFYYNIDQTNRRVYLYVYVTGGNSYGKWNTSVLQSNGGFWTSEFAGNQPNQSSFITISGTTVETAINADTVDGYHADAFVKKSGDTMTGNLRFSDANGIYTRHIDGENVTFAGDLYLNYNVNAPIHVGHGGAYTISADGSYYSGNAATATGSNALRESQQNKVVMTTFLDNNANIHRSNLQGELNLYRFSAQGDEANYSATYGYPAVDNHTLVFSIDGGNAWERVIDLDIRSTNIYTRAKTNGTWGSWKRIWVEGNSVTSAVWNDYAECRKSDSQEPGYVMFEKGDDSLSKTIERLQHFAGIVSDTWGFSQGETADAKTNIAVAGRVLAYPYRDRNEYKPGDCVCAAPGGKVDIMTREEIAQYPDRIVGTVSCVPEYEEWGGGEGADRDPVKVNGRIWIKVK